MKHILRRLAVLGLVAIPLLVISPEAHSAKKESTKRSTASMDRRADSSKTVRTPTPDAVRSTTKPHVAPVRVPTPSPSNRDSQDQTSLRSAASSGAAIQNNWISINHGGATEVAAGNLRLGISIAQPVAGFVEQGPYQLGLGYWYGAAASGSGPCDCPRQADYNSDTVLDNLDLNSMIDVLFFGLPNIQDPSCPSVLMDFNCDGTLDNLDLNALIDHLFFGGANPCQPCDCNSYPDDCPSFP